jgi:hypothetical protein
MTTLAQSPRRALTAEEKKVRDVQYRVQVKQFGVILKGLVQIYTSLNLLTSALGQAGKGAYLAYPNPNQPGTFIPFNRKHLRSAQARFAKSILELKNYLRVSMKKTRDPVKPESFSGVYTPVYAGEALRDFFTANPAGFGSLSPVEAERTQQGGAALMNSLPMVREGYFLRNTSTMLFYIYAHANQLQNERNAQFARSDEYMTRAFGGQIPAAFFSYKIVITPAQVDINGKTVVKEVAKHYKVTMQKAVSDGLIEGPMNTYNVIKYTRPDFAVETQATFNELGAGQWFNTYFYQNIAAANYFSKTSLVTDPNLAVAAQQLDRSDVRAAMLNEHTIVKNVSAEWHTLLEPSRKVVRETRKKEQDLIKKANKAAQIQIR